jgi:penicillin amidase
LSKEYGNDPTKWKWGNAHIAVSEHRPLSKVAILGDFFNISTEVPGDGFTINIGRLELGETNTRYQTMQAPSMRTIYDLSDLEKSLFIYQSGQSGWVQSKLYRNMNPLWAKNEYLPLQMKPEKSTRTLELMNK